MVAIIDSIQKVLETALSGRLTCPYECDVFMREFTSFKIGGPVSLMFFPSCRAELIEVCDLLRENMLEPLVLGRGSNLLVDDKSLDMIVINTLGLNDIKIASYETMVNAQVGAEAEIIAEAGVGLNALAAFCYQHGLTGLEFAHGIPGTLGGGIMMNAGAYDCELKDVVSHTTAFSLENGLYTVHGSEHEFGYRRSRFTDTCDIIASACLKLRKDDPELIRAKMDDFSKRRYDSQPLDVPSAGSVFKRPTRGYAAAWIEQAGLKGYSVGGAQVSERHAGFIINRSNATFSDVVSVMEHVQDVVLRRFDIRLEPEVRVVNAKCRMQNAELC